MISIPICSKQTGNELKLQPLNPTQHWSHWRPWDCPTPVRGSQEVDLPRDLVLERLSCLNLLGDLPVQESQEVITPRPAQGTNSQAADLPRPAQGFELQEEVTPQLPWDLHPDQGMPGSQVATGMGEEGRNKASQILATL